MLWEGRREEKGRREGGREGGRERREGGGREGQKGEEEKGRRREGGREGRRERREGGGREGEKGEQGEEEKEGVRGGKGRGKRGHIKGCCPDNTSAMTAY